MGSLQELLVLLKALRHRPDIENVALNTEKRTNRRHNNTVIEFIIVFASTKKCTELMFHDKFGITAAMEINKEVGKN